MDDHFHRSAQLHPDRIAVVGQERAWTYAQLHGQVVELAGKLVASGVGRGDHVTVLAGRSGSLVVALLAVLHADAVFVVVGQDAPAAQQRALLTAGAPKALVVCAGTGAASVQTAGMPVIRVGPDGAFSSDVGPEVPSPAVPFRAVEGDELLPAYVAFTSGTTGAPRGVRGAHAPVLRFLDWSIERFGYGPDDRFALLGGLGHDPLLREILTPLSVGGRLYVPSARMWANPGLLLSWLAETGCTTVFLTPTMVRRFGLGPLVRLPALARVFLGGEVATVADARTLRRLAPAARIHNGYGATETPQIVSCQDVTELAEEADSTVALPIGSGVPGTAVMVMDGVRAVGPGGVGEITVVGAQVADGYLPGPGVDGAAFGTMEGVEGASGVRSFRTGDRGRVLADGTIVVVGRADRQVKIAGVRVEPAAVEAHLRALPGVDDAVVRAEPTGAAGRPWTLCAVVATRDPAVTAQGLRSALLGRLDLPAVPERIDLVAELAMTANAKSGPGQVWPHPPSARWWRRR